MARLGQVLYLKCSTQIENVTNAQALKTKKKEQNTGSLLVGRPVIDHITRMKCLFLCANSPHLLAPMEGAQQNIVPGSYDYVLCIRSLLILRNREGAWCKRNKGRLQCNWPQQCEH